MTSASFTASGVRLHRVADRLAGKGFFRTLWDRIVAERQREAQVLLARAGIDRWCDSTERRLIDGVTRPADRL